MTRKISKAFDEQITRLKLQEWEVMQKALEAFVSTINATGGIDSDGAPLGDPEWIDLGDAYVQACKALGYTPEVAK